MCIVSYLTIKIHSSSEELADILGMRLSTGDQAFFSLKLLLFRVSYLGTCNFFQWSISSLQVTDSSRVWNTAILILGAFLSN